MVAQIKLDPAAATRKPGDANTVTASVLLSDGNPAAGAALRYTIAGANPGGGTATTSAAGSAPISWDGVHDGKDTLTVFYDHDASGTLTSGDPSATAGVDWVLPAPVIAKTANVEPISGTVLVKLSASSAGPRRPPRPTASSRWTRRRTSRSGRSSTPRGAGWS